MNHAQVEEALLNAESNLTQGNGLAGTGFWKAVGVVKSDPELVEIYAERIDAIDTAAHKQWALLTIPLWVGTFVAAAATGAFIWIIGQAYTIGEPWNGVAMIVGAVGLMTSLHGPAHLLVGSLFGIRYTKWFIGTLKRPQPGVKVSYGSYLRASPNQRALMHAAGAVASKLAIYLTLWAAVVARAPRWAIWSLVALGIFATATDVIFSTKSGDWKKFLRERRYARNAS